MKSFLTRHRKQHRNSEVVYTPIESFRDAHAIFLHERAGRDICGLSNMTTQSIGAAITEINCAIDEELPPASKPLRLRVADLSQQANIWKIFVEPMNSSSSLDESLEGAAAWWQGPPSGTADVLSVIPYNNQLNIRYLSSPPPRAGQEIRVYPPQYLEALRDCWETSDWATQCLAWLDRIN